MTEAAGRRADARTFSLGVYLFANIADPPPNRPGRDGTDDRDPGSIQLRIGPTTARLPFREPKTPKV